MTDYEDNPSIRGPLKYVVETPAPQLEAGRKISVNLSITNPYDVPVEIISAKTVVPAHFRDADGMIPGFWSQILRSPKKETEENTGNDATHSFKGESLQVISGRSLAPASVGTQDSGPIILQPGNTILRAFTLKTKQTYLFTPSVHTLNAQVCYTIDGGEQNFDTVKYQLNVRAPFKALVTGSLFGSVVGTILRYRTPLDSYNFRSGLPFFIALATAMLVGAVMVIAFARKKDAQPFITVEDFWGGFFVGFVAGYVGTSVLDKVLPEV
jgi:hypothetical protein